MNEVKLGWIVTFETNGETYYASAGGGTTNKIPAVIYTSPEQAMRWCKDNLNRCYWNSTSLEQVTISYGEKMDIT